MSEAREPVPRLVWFFSDELSVVAAVYLYGERAGAFQ